MKLTIVAATGRIGRHLLDQALAAGHDVTAVARRPDQIPAGVRRVAVDLTEPDSAALQSAVAGSDAVLSGLGPRRRAEIGIVSPGTEAILAAMHAAGARRILAVSGAGVGTVPTPTRPDPPRREPGAGALMRSFSTPLARVVLGQHFIDVALMEDALRQSDLEWTAVRVPLLTDRRPRGRYRIAYDTSVRNGLRIGRADAAGFMLHAMTDPATVRQAVSVAY